MLSSHCSLWGLLLGATAILGPLTVLGWPDVFLGWVERVVCGRVIGRVEGPLHGCSPPALPPSAWSGALPRDAAHTETFMASYTSGELVWDMTEAAAPRWILLLDEPPGTPPLRLDPRDPSTPQTASTRQ